MLSYLLYLFRIFKKIENESNQRSFYLCTRSEISELQRISKYGNFFQIEKADFESVENFFEDLQIKKISYEIKSGENLILRAINSKGINVLNILISSSENIEFVNVVEMNTFKYEDCFDEVVYIVENDFDVMEKMKMALKFINLNKRTKKVSRDICEMIKSIKEALKPELKITFFEVENLDELNIKLDLHFFVISNSELPRLPFDEYAERSNNFCNQKLKNFVGFNIKIIENVVDTLKKVNDEITKSHFDRFKEDLSNKIKKAASELNLIKDSYLKINEKLLKFSSNFELK